jgi:hypothetical protein
VGGPDEPDTGVPHDGGVRVCNNEARHAVSANVFINMSSTDFSARAKHGCGGDYGVVSGRVDDSVAETVAMQPVMVCEGAGWDGVSDGVMGSTVVLPLQSEHRVCSTWEQDETALLIQRNYQHFECKQDQPNLGADRTDSD